MFLFVFTICLIILCLVTFQNNKFPNLFFASIIFLPNYYGIEISYTLPLITASRIMYCIFFVYVFKNKRKKIMLSKEDIISFYKEYRYFVLYFAFRMISNLSYIFSYSQAIKAISSLIFEQLFLLLGIYLLDLTNEEIISIIKTIVNTAFAFFIIGIIESISFFRPFDYLYTVSRYMLNDHYIRLGLLRATTTFGIPNFYGNMCVMILPLILFLYDKYKRKTYLIIAVTDFFAIIHSGCRADIIFFVLIIFIYFLGVVRKPERKKSFFINLFFSLLSVAIIISLLSLISPYCRYFYLGTFKSVLNEFGFNFDLNANLPDGVSGYGANSVDATQSRIFQFSGIIYALKTNPLFGIGAGADQRNEIMYYSKGIWKNVPTFDIGYVEIIMTEGLIGFCGYILLFYFLIRNAFSKDHENSSYSKAVIIQLITTYLLCMFSSANMFSILILYIIIIIRMDSICILE